MRLQNSPEGPIDPIGERPAYTVGEAARYLKLPVATLRSWVMGRSYPTAAGGSRFQPLIHPPCRKPPLLSFSNLVEAHVLRSLRTDHGVSVKDLRLALRYAEETLGFDRLLLRRELRAKAGRLFLERYGELIDLSASGQLAMRKLFERHLERVVWNRRSFPVRLHPFLSSEAPAQHSPIALDPKIAFGRPFLVRRGVSTQVIAERIDAGETVASLAQDYDLSPAEIEDAVLYERAA